MIALHSPSVAAQVVVQEDSIVVVIDSTSVANAADAVAEALGKKEEKKARFFNGFGVGADFVGLVQKITGSDWAQMEVLARMNIRERFFPVFELGLGEADHEGRDLDNHFHVRSPYFRLGCDYNIRYKHLDGYRFFIGLRCSTNRAVHQQCKHRYNCNGDQRIAENKSPATGTQGIL